MAWPLSQDYNEAVQTPARNFADPDLRRGQSATNALGLPMPYSGTFADVYEIRCPDGGRWAVKCFTREIPGLRGRYLEISRHLRRAKLPFTVDFSYLDQGIRVAGRWYPVLKMQWIEGLTLNQFIAQYADKPTMLEALLHIWERMAKYLRAADIAHCDLQHGNVLLVPGASANSLALKLVDYDGMFVPALAGKKSGEVGHPAYQHPQRMREGTYGLEVDCFSLLLIATALRAVAVGGRPLWEKYDNGDNLLFKEADLQAPTKSYLFLELLRSPDPMTAVLTDHLLKALRGGVVSAPLLEEVLPEAPTAALPRPARPTPSPPPVAQMVSAPGGSPATAVAVAPVLARPNLGGWTPDDPVSTAGRPVSRGRRARKRSTAATAITCMAVMAMLLVGLGAVAGTAFLLVRSRLDKTQPGVTVVEVRPDAGKDVVGAQPGQPGQDPRVIDQQPGNPKGDGNPNPKDGNAPRPALPGRSIINSIGMRLVLIPAGKSRMGASRDEGEKDLEKFYEKEGPPHEVTITRPFWMGAFEVTQGEYEAVMGFNPSWFAATGEGKEKVKGLDTRRFPVEMVSWHEVAEFCRRLSEMPAEKKAGRSYRLPTEAEWEYACRAGTATPFHFGRSLSSRQANFNGERPYGNAEKGPRIDRPTPVGSYPPNAWGLHDMHGNVWEWCLDGPRPYTAGSVQDPHGPEAGPLRVLRGGSWAMQGVACRSAIRKVREATLAKKSYRTPHSGFRVVCESRPAEPESDD